MALNNDKYADFIPEKKDNTLDNKTDNGSGSGVDAEKGNKSRFGHSGNSTICARIAPVLPHLQGYDLGSDDSGSDILGKQIELEAGNAIQYRTCSWQKVSSLLTFAGRVWEESDFQCLGSQVMRDYTNVGRSNPNLATLRLS